MGSVLPGFEEIRESSFSKEYIHTLAQELSIRKSLGFSDIDGKEWEKIHAECLGVEWVSKNMPVVDVPDGLVAWSAKTVKGKIDAQIVKLISARISPIFEHKKAIDGTFNPTELGELLISSWNERIDNALAKYSSLRLVVLIRNNKLDEFTVFQKDLTKYDPMEYSWRWNDRTNLYGYLGSEPKFIWQPHGAQLSINESVEKPTTITLNYVRKVPKKSLVGFIGFNESSYDVK